MRCRVEEKDQHRQRRREKAPVFTDQTVAGERQQHPEVLGGRGVVAGRSHAWVEWGFPPGTCRGTWVTQRFPPLIIGTRWVIALPLF